MQESACISVLIKFEQDVITRLTWKSTNQMEAIVS